MAKYEGTFTNKEGVFSTVEMTSTNKTLLAKELKSITKRNTPTGCIGVWEIYEIYGDGERIYTEPTMRGEVKNC